MEGTSVGKPTAGNQVGMAKVRKRHKALIGLADTGTGTHATAQRVTQSSVIHHSGHARGMQDCVVPSDTATNLVRRKLLATLKRVALIGVPVGIATAQVGQESYQRTSEGQ